MIPEHSIDSRGGTARRRAPTRLADGLGERSGMGIPVALILASVLSVLMGPVAFASDTAPTVARGMTPVDDAAVACRGQFVQGGMAVCRADPGSRIRIGAASTRASADGGFVIGFDRDAPPVEILRVWPPDGTFHERSLEIAARRFDVSRIDGLPPSQVSKYTKAQLARIASSTARKKKGDASRAALSAYRGGFGWPVAGRKTSSFGAQRVLNGIRKRPHYGVDLAAPLGTPIVAPAAGVVTLADEDLYFEGAMVVIDHGEGFLSKYLHVSRVDVEVGQVVARGEVLGAVGNRGRSTGPHLCWRLKWRDRNLDPELWLESRPASADHAEAAPLR